MEQANNRYKYFDNETDGMHLHTLDMQPLFGTSTITKIISKSQPFMWWAVKKALETLGFVSPTRKEGTKYVKNDPVQRLIEAKKGLERIKVCTPSEYLKLLDTAYTAHNTAKEKAAEDGTDLHAELERFVKNHISGKHESINNNGIAFDYQAYPEKIIPFINWTLTEVKRFLWSEMHCYSETLWCGGISDVGYEKFDDTYGVLDFKSATDAYVDNFIQVSGYDFQITENGGFDENGNKIFDLGGMKITEYAVLPFGMATPQVMYRKDVEALQEGFKACLVLHKLINLNI